VYAVDIVARMSDAELAVPPFAFAGVAVLATVKVVVPLVALEMSHTPLYAAVEKPVIETAWPLENLCGADVVNVKADPDDAAETRSGVGMVPVARTMDETPTVLPQLDARVHENVPLATFG